MQRDLFPIFDNKHYINACSKGALSIPVRDAYHQYLTDWAEQGSPWELWVSHLEKYRRQVARLLGATADEIAVKTSVSDAVNALASSINFSSGRHKIIVDDYAFPTTAQIWHAQASRGAEVVHVRETDDYQLPLERYEAVIDEQTAIVSLTHVCFRHGGRNPHIEAIVKLAHEHGALVLLDSFQALGTMPIDVRALGVDFLVGGMLKYLLGSAGLAFLYAKQSQIQEHTPTATGWFAQDNIFALDIYAYDPSRTARRFESGTPSNPNIYAGIAGLDLIQEIGIHAIQEQIDSITGAIKARANDSGYVIATPPDHGAMIAIQSTDVTQLVNCLADDGVIVSERDGNLRISPHFYNDSSDVDALFAGMAAHPKLLV